MKCVVCAGPLVLKAAQGHGVNILSVDSEHSALTQCLIGQDLSAIKQLILTASGGPFRAFAPAELKQVTVEQASVMPYPWIRDSSGKSLSSVSSVAAGMGLPLWIKLK